MIKQFKEWTNENSSEGSARDNGIKVRVLSRRDDKLYQRGKFSQSISPSESLHDLNNKKLAKNSTYLDYANSFKSLKTALP